MHMNIHMIMKLHGEKRNVLLFGSRCKRREDEDSGGER